MIFNVSGGGSVLPKGGSAGWVLTKTETGTTWAKAPGQPHNHLDNSDFTQFVAQAGIGGLHGTQAYAGDRWILDSGEVTGVANENGNGYSGITLNGTIRQIVANPPEVGTAAVEMISGTAEVSYADGAVTITSAGGVIKNAALYEGTYTAENMPKYQPRGYGVEVVNCNGGALSMELLWKNGSPLSSFSPQTINLSLSGYKIVLIRTIYNNGYGYGRVETVLVGGGTHLLILQPAGMSIASRQVSATSTGVNFGDGMAGTSFDQNHIIPQAIYGIKG